MKRIGIILFITLLFLTGCVKAQTVTPSPSSKEETAIVTAAPEDAAVSETPVPTEVASVEPTPTLTPTPAPSPKGIVALEDSAKAPVSAVEKKKEVIAKKTVSPYKIVVDVTNQVVTVFTRDKDGDFTKIARQMIATTGKSSTPTPLGTFIMPGQKGRWGFFSEFDVYAQYFSRIRGGILFHSVIFAKADTNTLVTSTYNNLGNPGSHGCIRLQVGDAKWIYDHAGAGTQVDVVRRKSNHALTASLKPPYIGPKIISIAIVPAPVTMKIGETLALKVKATYDNKTVLTKYTDVIWTITKNTAITIKSRTITAKTVGTATITATLKGVQSLPVTVTVILAPATPTPTPVATATPTPKPTAIVTPKVTSVAIIEPATPITLKVGETRQTRYMKVKVTYDDKTTKIIPAGISSGITWSVSDVNLISFKTEIFKALNPGTATIKAIFNGKTSASLTVTVIAAPATAVPAA